MARVELLSFSVSGSVSLGSKLVLCGRGVLLMMMPVWGVLSSWIDPGISG